MEKEHPTQHPEQMGLVVLKEEGWGETENSMAAYPINEMLIRKDDRTVYEVVRRIKQQQFIMNPDFQRDFVWDQKKQSKLIESVIMRIPLPVFYLAEDMEGKMIVVDGLQRLSVFYRFMENEFELILPDRPELNGKNFDDLLPKFKNRIEDCHLILYILDAMAHEQVRLDIFDRVNSGEPLSRQQMRNCLYIGPATRFLKEEAGKELFRTVTDRGLDQKKMRDREFINRFCAFQIFGHEEYGKGNMDEFLSRALKHLNKHSNLLEKLSSELERSLKNNHTIFYDSAFRRHAKSVINAALWDVMSTGLARYPEELVEHRKEHCLEKFKQLIDTKEFADSITTGTSGIKAVKTRFEMANNMLQEVFG